jgi:nucleoside 2-deoxyribosyltransferase
VTTANVYLAAQFARRDELRGYRDALAVSGVVVTSRWLDSHEDDGHCMPAYLARCAVEDLEDIDRADMVVCFTESPETSAKRGGRHVELGYALARGKTVIVAGPRENVFCHLPQVLHIPVEGEFLTAFRCALEAAGVLRGVP